MPLLNNHFHELCLVTVSVKKNNFLVRLQCNFHMKITPACLCFFMLLINLDPQNKEIFFFFFVFLQLVLLGICSKSILENWVYRERLNKNVFFFLLLNGLFFFFFNFVMENQRRFLKYFFEHILLGFCSKSILELSKKIKFVKNIIFFYR